MKLFVAFAALCVGLWLAVWGWARTPGYTPLADGERAAVMRALRGGPVEGLERTIAGPLVVTVYVKGVAERRDSGEGRTLADAVRSVRAGLGETALPAGARLKVDLVMARAPVVTRIAPLLALALQPGVDGIGVKIGDRETLLLADDLLKEDLVAANAPVRGMEFTLGLDGPAVLRRLAQASGASAAAWKGRKVFRFRAEQLVEPADPDARRATPALPVTRGNVPGPALTRENLRAAAVAGGDYLVRHLDAEGRFDYEYYTSSDQVVRGGYSLPRHSGAAWYLAQLHAVTHDPALAVAARRALDWLQAQTPPGCDDPAFACVGTSGGNDDQVDLGSAALTLVALADYQRGTGDSRYEPWARRLANFILSMQKPNGDFCHLYATATARRDEKTKLLYYSGEAIFGLAKLLAVPGLAPDPRWAAALDRGLDYLTGEQYRHLAGQFFFLEDHWTCMAADVGWDRLPDPARRRYSHFCDQFTAFLRRTQFGPDESVVGGQPDFAGAYGFSPFLPPHATPVGSRSETTISAYNMDLRVNAPPSVTTATRAQILAGARFLLAHQIRDDAAWLMPDPAAARGGLLMSDVARYVRIDFIQHSCSAMLRAADLL